MQIYQVVFLPNPSSKHTNSSSTSLVELITVDQIQYWYVKKKRRRNLRTEKSRERRRATQAEVFKSKHTDVYSKESEKLYNQTF